MHLKGQKRPGSRVNVLISSGHFKMLVKYLIEKVQAEATLCCCSKALVVSRISNQHYWQTSETKDNMKLLCSDFVSH